MVEKRGVKAIVKVAAKAAKPTEAKTEAEPAAPEKVETKAEAAALVKAEAVPVEKEAKTTPAKRTTTRKTAAKTTPRKETAPKEAAKKEAAPKAEAKKEVATEAAAKKETAKETPTKRAAEPKTTMHFQFDNEGLVAKDVLDRAVKAFRKLHRGIEIRTIDLYIAVNEGAAYYVVNSEGGDDYKIVL